MSPLEKEPSQIRNVITISRQMGSLGCEVARLAAEFLDYRVIWRELINQAARQAGAPEMALAAIDDLGLLGICPSPQMCRAYRQAVKEVMEKLTDEGKVVIVGRAGQAILRGRPAVIHVRVIAPMDMRVARVARQKGVSLDSARSQIEASDRSRRNYLRRFYQIRWDDPELYDLVVNTGRFTPQEAANIIRESLLSPLTGTHTTPSLKRENARE